MLRRAGPIGTLVARPASPLGARKRAEEGFVAGFAEGEAEGGEAEGELGRDELAVGEVDLAVPGRLQAPARTRAITPSAEAPRSVLTIKGNATIRIGLRFRYHPAPEAGSPTLTPRASLEGVAVGG